MGTLLSWLLRPSNLIIYALSIALFVSWTAAQERKVQLADCHRDLGICQKDVEVYKTDIASATTIIDVMKKNITSIKRQLAEWKQIANDSQEYSKRILAAAEGQKSCEVYHAENAKLATDITGYFNNSVRGKVNRSTASPTGDSAAGKVLPAPGSPEPGQPSK